MFIGLELYLYSLVFPELFIYNSVANFEKKTFFYTLAELYAKTSQPSIVHVIVNQ